MLGDFLLSKQPRIHLLKLDVLAPSIKRLGKHEVNQAADDVAWQAVYSPLLYE
jgi:hypothetical protein